MSAADLPDDGTRTVLILDGAGPGNLDAALRIISLGFQQLDAKLFSTVLPELVILPLFGPDFDAIDALQRLERLGYRGIVIVQGPSLPNRAIVERELGTVAPQLTVKLTEPKA